MGTASVAAENHNGGSPIVAVVLPALVCACVAIACGCRHIYLHLRSYAHPEYQLHIVRILAMVPIYSATACAALIVRQQHTILWLEVVRDSYEAYVIYNFVVLLINYGGGDRQLSYFLEGQPRLYHTWPLSHWLPPMQLGPSFINFVRVSVLQFVFVKPAAALLKVNLYHSWQADQSHTVATLKVLVVIVENMSVSAALYGLIMFYHAAEEVLRPHHPLPKFLCVKAVVFFSFWQGIALSIAVQLGVLTDIEGFTAHEQATGLQDFLICLEMVIASIAHYFVFSYKEYTDPVTDVTEYQVLRNPFLRNFGDVVDFRDLLSDAKARFSGGRDFERELRDSEPLLPSADRVLGSLSPRSRSARNSHDGTSTVDFDLSNMLWNPRLEVSTREKTQRVENR